MSAEIISLHQPNGVGDGLKVPVNDVLDAAKDRLSAVVVVGLAEDGSLYVAGSDGAEASYFIMERAKMYLLDHSVTRF
jgi:hypothetical protein